MNAQSEFEKAIAALVEIEQAQKLVPRTQYRVYYDQDKPLHVAHGPDWPDIDLPWIEISKEQAGTILSCKIINNVAVNIDTISSSVVKLTKDPMGPYSVITENMALILEPGETHDNVTTYSKDFSGYS